MAPGEEHRHPTNSLLNYSTDHNDAILTYPVLAQLHTFFPQRSEDINWKTLRLLQFHSKSNPLGFSTLQSAMQNYHEPTLLLISGYQTNGHDTSAKTYVVVGALINCPWTKKEMDDTSESTRHWKTILFQLAPVQQVYATREGNHSYMPVLQSNGIGIGREVKDLSLETETGTTGLVVDSRLEKAAFEHGKPNSRRAQFEGVCPFGTAKAEVMKMEISALEVWGC